MKPAARREFRKPAPHRPPTGDGPTASVQTFAHALAALEEVMRFEGAADGVLSRHFRSYSTLGSAARGIVAEGVYAVLRRRLVYQQLAQSGHGPLARRLLVLALADLRVDLRSVATGPEIDWLTHIAAIDRGALPASVRSNLPDWLWARLVDQRGEAGALELADALNRPAPLDVRVNRIRATREAALARLADSGPAYAAAAMPYAPDGIRFANKPALQRHPLFEDGTLEVQDEGSQLLASLVAPKRGEMVVDFCAGAGGKTLALGALMRNTGRLYAFDVSAKRLERLKPRLARSGLSNVVPTVLVDENDVRVKRLAGKIDRVLVDAPCSGLGTLRRNPDLKWRQTPSSVAEMTVKQAAILASAARLLKLGGRLVYATCSLLDEENDGIVDAFLAAHPDFARMPAGAELARQRIALPMGDSFRLDPLVHGTDGFFAAVLERRVLA